MKKETLERLNNDTSLNFTKDNTHKYKDGKLYYVSRVCTREDDTKCVRNINEYKLFAYRIESNVPSSTYILVDTETNEVYIARTVHYTYSPLNKIVDSLTGKLEEERRKREEYYRNIDFDPLAGI